MKKLLTILLAALFATGGLMAQTIKQNETTTANVPLVMLNDGNKMLARLQLDYIDLLYVHQPAVLQIECHPYAQRVDIRKKAAKYNIQIESWFPLGGSGGTQKLLNDKTINKIAKAHGKTAAQVILRWHIQEGFSVIPGSKNPAHIKENIGIFDFTLTDSEMKEIRSLNTESRFYIPRQSDLQNFLRFNPAV